MEGARIESGFRNYIRRADSPGELEVQVRMPSFNLTSLHVSQFLNIDDDLSNKTKKDARVNHIIF